MNDFLIYPMPFNTVLYLYDIRDEIDLDPPYQRMGDIWPLDKRQLLIDSLLNQFDLPKLYLHEYPNPQRPDRKYAIIDGRQRLESIWGFMDGTFNLSSDFEYNVDPLIDASGLSYTDLATSYPRLKSRLDATQLPVTLIKTDDVELIEEMFSRLNEATPLTAPEKRNAFGGPLPPIIRSLSRHPFFTDCLPFSNRRYRHFDLATKFLYLEFVRSIEDTRKVYLDYFVREFGAGSSNGAMALKAKVKINLERMRKVFIDSDALLNNLGSVVLYYLLFKRATDEHWVESISHTALETFEGQRRENRARAEQDVASANYELLEFDRLAQSMNSSPAIKYRLEVLASRVFSILSTPLPS